MTEQEIKEEDTQFLKYRLLILNNHVQMLNTRYQYYDIPGYLKEIEMIKTELDNRKV